MPDEKGFKSNFLSTVKSNPKKGDAPYDIHGPVCPWYTRSALKK
jgi:hypothetical protein